MRSNPFRLHTDNSDRACGIVVTTIAIVLYASARDLPFGTLSAPDAGFFPKALSALLAILGLGVMLRRRTDAHEHSEFTLRSWAIPLATVVLLAYSALLDKVGFVLSTVAVLFLLMTVYGRIRWMVALVASVSTVVICYLGFTELGVPLPQGVLSIF